MPDVVARTPARFPKAVLLTADANYFPQAMFTASTLADNHPDRDFDICLASEDDLSGHPLIQALGIRFLRVENALEAYPTSNRISSAAYLRLLVQAFLAQDYARILYMDSDMLHLRGDLSVLMDIDIGRHAVAAVRDDNQLRKPGRVPRDLRALGIGHVKYLNSGLLLIDTARFADQKIAERALALALAHPEAMKHHDQSALNGVLRGEWAELPLIWNFQFCQKTLFFSVEFRPAILHFITDQKPWTSRYGIYPRWIMDLYRSFFQEHFPDAHEAMKGLPSPDQRPAVQRLMLLLHAVSARRYLANLERFSNDWDVKP